MRMRFDDESFLKEMGWTTKQLAKGLRGLDRMPHSRRRRITLVNIAKGRPSNKQRAALARLVCERLESVAEG